MRTTPPSLTPIFRSDAQLGILGTLFCGPKEAYAINELAAAGDTSAATASREVELLRANGIVHVTNGPGRSKLVSVDWDMPWAGDLRRILAHTGGLIPALSALLRSEPNVQAAYIFGSWARRYRGEPGHFPRDIDLVVATDTPPFDLDISWREVASDLRIEINPIYRPADFDPTTDGLVAGSPVVELNLDLEEQPA